MDLKPCPFCGNTEGKGMGVRINTENVYCQCGCLKPLQGWNARPLEDTLRAELEAAEAKIERQQKELEEWRKYSGYLLAHGFTDLP